VIKKINATKNFNAGAIIVTCMRQLLVQNMTYDDRSLRLVPHPFTQPPKILCFTMLFNRLNTPYVTRVAWTLPTQHPKLHLDRFSHSCTAHSRQSLYFTITMCVKTRLMHD